jgi:sugar phosphate isomerase/epimerase
MDTTRVAVSSRSFHSALLRGRMRLEQVPSAVRELGFGALELDDTDLRPPSRFKRRLLDSVMHRYFGAGAFYREYTSTRLLSLHQSFEEAAVRLAAWVARTDFTLEGRAARWQMGYLEGAIAAANDFGARLVCITAGGSPGASPEEVARCVDGLIEATNLAARFRTRLALESGEGLATTAESVLRLVEPVNSVNLGVCLKLGANAEDFAALAPYAIHVHAGPRATDSQNGTLGVDYRNRLSDLRSRGYSGWVSIEFDSDSDSAHKRAQIAGHLGNVP